MAVGDDHLRWAKGDTLSKKTALVTGSTDGVGRYVAVGLAERGVKVLLHGRNRQRAEEVLGDISRNGGNCGPTCPCDFNHNGVLNSQDFFDFLACFFTTGCPAADYNNSGAVNSQDFFDFLTCFFAPPPGCL